MEITDFLLARIAEDEEVARAATQGPWRWVEFTSRESYARNALAAPDAPRSPEGWEKFVLHPEASDNEGAYISVDETDERHIARWDPTRVLAECEAKRRLIQSELELDGWMRNPDDVLVFLALPYADHPDYDGSWRP